MNRKRGSRSDADAIGAAQDRGDGDGDASGAEDRDGWREDESRAAILSVAGAHLERYGAPRTRIDGIARDVGMSRNMILRFFRTRQELLDAVILDRVAQVAERVRPRIWSYPTLAEAAVEGSVLLVEAARSDPVLSLGSGATTALHLCRLLLRRDSPAQDQAARTWGPVLERARERGEVRADLDPADFVEWLSSLQMMFWLRRHLEVDGMRRQLWTYLVPALRPGA